MSGSEVAGLVLGVLPLVINALAEYREGKGALSTLLKFKGLLDDLIHQLSTQKTAFYLDILQLLREAKVSAILDDIDPPESRCISVLRDARTADEVKKYLGQLYSPFLETLGCYEKCLKEITSKLETIVRPKTAAKDDLNVILHAHMHPDPSSLSFVKGRFKFAIDRKSLDVLVQDLRTERYSLGKLLKRVKTQRDWEARQPSAYSTKMAKLFSQVQVGAASLYRAACRCWTCECQHQHTIMVRLDNRIVNSLQPTGAQPAHITFRVCFPTGETLIQEAEVRARTNQIRLSETGIWQATDDAICRTASAPVTNICEEAREARRRGHAIALALDLTADAFNLREGVSKSQQSFKSTTTLGDFLATTSQDVRMTLKQQSLLALDVATAVSQLQRTPWSGIPWNNQTIKFLVEGDGKVATWAPIVEQSIQHATLPPGHVQPLHGTAQSPKATVLELAILMLEILHHKSLESWAAESHQGQGTATWGERLEAADRWLGLSDDKLLPNHLNAIEACIQQCVGRNSSWNMEFQRLFCENVNNDLGMAAEEHHQGELQSLGVEVFKVFQQLIEQPWVSDELTVLPSRRSIESEEERFRLWTQSMGLMQVGHASLDYRVRDSSVIKSSLTDVLSELLDHLKDQRDRTIGKDGSTISDDSDDEISVSSFGSNSFHEADFRLSSVVKRLDALYKLAARIRNPRNRPQRPTRDLYKHIPEGERAQYRENQEQIETALVAFVQQRHLLESVTEEQLKDLDTSRQDLLEQYASGTNWLIRRISLANSRRKQQFVYWEGHTQLLARDVATKVPVIRKPVSVSAVDVRGTQFAGQTAFSVATSATRLVSENITGPDDLKSVISHHSRVSTVVSPQEEKLAWPPAPGRLGGRKFFTCPYCKVLCPGRYLSADNWRSHQTVTAQLPYQCTYEDCPDANRLYGQRQEWIDHENQHRRVWHCHAHQEEFETQPEFHRHIVERHPEEDLSLEVEAAFGNRDEAISGHSEDSNRVVEHRGRRGSIANDFTPAEKYRFESLFGEEARSRIETLDGPVTVISIQKSLHIFDKVGETGGFVHTIELWRLHVNEDLEKMNPIEFLDAVGRKFTVLFCIGMHWRGMAEFINQAFLHVDILGPHVEQERYDLISPLGEIMLPQVWEHAIEPGWTIEMRMWPLESTGRPYPTPGPPPAPKPVVRQSLFRERF
ncbi:hypothetical protein CPLU01_15301 [Colletotrichum plurivorum]|uniref:Fungal N-terminal domain-containing protein n=1 Tax=Colletotrichum plurivorum TaxID=2175906 RepID=A0A8H6JC82_9PEZI|nr:hypothetical protein CPLU01_15301 [Colletotrichum plurivorum]